MFPTLDRINYKPNVSYETNNVIMSNCVQYGHIGTGKTETCRAIVEQAIKYYGEANVNAVIDDGDLSSIMSRGMDNKLIQILIIDDATLSEVDDTEIRAYFKIRHIYKQKFGLSNGYILTIFNVHRFHGLKTELRTSIDIAIWRSQPTNPYDRNVVTKFVGKDGIEDLEYIESVRLDNPAWNAVSLFTSRIWRGIALIPMAEKNYIRTIETLQLQPSKSNIGAVYPTTMEPNGTNVTISWGEWFEKYGYPTNVNIRGRR